MALGQDIGKGFAAFGKGYASGIKKRGLLREKRWTPRTKEEWQEAEKFKAGLKAERTKPKYDDYIRAARGGQMGWDEVEVRFPTKDVEKTRFDLDVRDARRGQTSWDILRERYPQRRSEINTLHQKATPIRKSTEFKEPTGLFKGIKSAISPKVATISPNAQFMIDQIKNEADWQQFMAEGKRHLKPDEYNQVLERFGRR